MLDGCGDERLRWHYLIYLDAGEILKCPGDQPTASRHLRQIREWYIEEHLAATGRKPDTVPWLIGVYPPGSVDGPEGKGGVFSYGYSPTLLGSIDTEPGEWQWVQ